MTSPLTVFVNSESFRRFVLKVKNLVPSIASHDLWQDRGRMFPLSWLGSIIFVAHWVVGADISASNVLSFSAQTFQRWNVLSGSIWPHLRWNCKLNEIQGQSSCPYFFRCDFIKPEISNSSFNCRPRPCIRPFVYWWRWCFTEGNF